MGRPTHITIDLAALQHNLNQIRQLAPHSAILAMVKSNAYGHGIIRIANALSTVDALGVACIEEGMLLRQAGIQTPIALMEGLFTGDELVKAAKEHFILIVHHESQVTMLEKTNVPPQAIWLKIDTGMHRLGFKPEEVAEIYQRLMACPSVKKPFGLMTHFAEADATDNQATLEQMNLFNAVTGKLTGPKSLANSAGIIAWPTSHADWVRPGIMLYGASPFPNQNGEAHHLRPVMTLHSEIIALQSVAKGAKIGYGGTWVAPTDMLIGVVAMGYGDGYPQFAESGTPMLVNAKLCPLVGRVSMDMLTVDLRSQPTVKVGDPVILWGRGLPVEVIARNNHTTPYELLTRITQRVQVKII